MAFISSRHDPRRTIMIASIHSLIDGDRAT
jgi:hypothetical protein